MGPTFLIQNVRNNVRLILVHLVRLNDSVSIPISELKHLTGLAADETLKDSFSVLLGFAPCGTWNEGKPALCVRASAVASSQAHCSFSVSVWYRGSAPSVREAGSPPNVVDEINVDSLFDEDDALFARLADTLDPQTRHESVPHDAFIAHTVSSNAPTFSQHSQPPELLGVPDWDDDIPPTPTSDGGRLLEDLWNAAD